MSNSRVCDKCGNIIRCGEYGYAKYINHQEIGRSTLCPDCIKELMVFLKTPPTQETEKVLPVLTPQDAQPTHTAGTGGGFRLLDNPHYPDYKQNGRCTFDE